MIDKLIVVSLLTFLIGIKNENKPYKLEKDINDFDSFGSTIFNMERRNNLSTLISENIDNSYLIESFNKNIDFKFNDNYSESSLNSNEYKKDYLDDISILESKESVDFSKLPSIILNNEKESSNDYIINMDYEINKDTLINQESIFNYKDSLFVDKAVFETLNNKNYSFIDNNPNKSIKNKLNTTDFAYSFSDFIN